MNRSFFIRRHISLARNLLLACWLPTVVIPQARLADAATRPNIVLIMTDDQGYGDIGLHDNPMIKTPHIDQFAREGVQLTRFYCSPVCAPTRASLLTGRYHYRTGVIHTSRGGAKMYGEETTIAELLQAAGYTTAIFGKWHLGDNYPMRPQDQGFLSTLVHKSGGIGQTPDRPNSYFDSLLWRDGHQIQTDGYCTDVFFDAAMQFMETYRNQPFFVYLPTNAPHTPLEISPEYYQPYAAQGLDENTAKIYGMVSNIDDNLGRLLEKLEELELVDNTLVMFLSDNGPQQNRYTANLRGRKSSTYEGGIRVPCFLQWPGHWSGGRKIETIAAHIDLLPTLLDAAGCQLPELLSVDGQSLLPILEGSGQASPNRQIFFQCHRGLHPQRYQNCAVVTQRFKMVGYPGTFSQENLDTSGTPILELFDIQKDSSESKNLASEQTEVLNRMRNAYDKWFDDVKATRQFAPGLIVLDSDIENPIRLCRYQDGNYQQEYSTGWTVRLVHSGLYDIRINRSERDQPGNLFVDWLGHTIGKPLAKDQDSAQFHLSSGGGILDIWFQNKGQDRVHVKDNSTVGDVEIKRYGDM